MTIRHLAWSSLARTAPVWMLLEGWHWDLDSFTLLCLEECVGQHDGVYFGHGWIIHKIWVNVEENGHIHLCMEEG